MSTPQLAHPNTRFCAYIKVDGKRCGTPAWQDFDHCWHHHGLKSRFDSQKFSIPALDDANSIQVAVMDVINALLSRRIDRADAYALFYGLYLAKSNLKGTTLCPPTPDDLAEMLEKARAEGREQGSKEALAKMERDRAKKGEEESESLAAYLLRELKPAPDRSAASEPEPEWWTKKPKGANGA